MHNILQDTSILMTSIATRMKKAKNYQVRANMDISGVEYDAIASLVTVIRAYTMCSAYTSG
jgi:hypothetical protein